MSSRGQGPARQKLAGQGHAGSQQQRLSALLEPVVSTQGYDLEQVSVAAAGRRSLVRVVVDQDGGVSLDDIAELSRAISAALDAEDGALGPSAYTLEVTSPGVDRPLTEPRHWRRSTGRLVTVQTDTGPLTGRVLRADEHAVSLDVGGSEQTLRYAGLGPGRVQVEFGRRVEPAEPAEPAQPADPDEQTDKDD